VEANHHWKLTMLVIDYQEAVVENLGGAKVGVMLEKDRQGGLTD